MIGYALRPLANLETTLVSLVLELLRAPQKYPQLVLSPPVDAQGEHAPNAVRITHHYARALQAFGYLPGEGELQQAFDWFAMPFPHNQYISIDPVEMSRLEALLMLCPITGEVIAPELMGFIQPRLECLLNQRSDDNGDGMGGNFEIHDNNPNFDNLWSLKVLRMAHERRALTADLMSQEHLEAWLDRLVEVGRYKDKDLALALRLRFEHFGNTLAPAHEEYLERLIKPREDGLELWDIRNDLKFLVYRMSQHELQVGDVAENRKAFREMIVSTCYVIENLVPLTERYPEIAGRVERAMLLWWNTFSGEDAANKLRGLFPEPYDYLTILARTVVSVCAYAGASNHKTMAERLLPNIYRALAAQGVEQADSREQQNIGHALREWLPLSLDAEPEKLKLGMSGTNVVRIKPYLTNPLYPDVRLQFVDSLIVKYGPIDEIELERRNYARLPRALHDCFVPIPRASYTDRTEGRAYVIMADLAGYYTLYEQVKSSHNIVPPDAILNELGDFLMRMHEGGITLDAAQAHTDHNSLLLEVYLLPMQEYAGRSFRLLREHDLLSKGEQYEFTRVQDHLNFLLGTLVQQQDKFTHFPTAYMHGDMHSRNIMLRGIATRDSNGSPRQIDFRLIDLEKVEPVGDAAVDAGQLLIDLELAQRRMSNGDPKYHALGKLMTRLAEDYTAFGRKHNDEKFAARVQLAKARALLRIAKGRTKAATQRLQESRKAPAIDIAYEMLDYASQATNHLENMIDSMDGREISLLE